MNAKFVSIDGFFSLAGGQLCYEDPEDSGCGSHLLRLEFEKNKPYIWAQLNFPPCSKCGSIRHLTLDHIVPLSAGGTNKLNNIQVLCWKCHIKKDNKYNKERYHIWKESFDHSNSIEKVILPDSLS